MLLSAINQEVSVNYVFIITGYQNNVKNKVKDVACRDEPKMNCCINLQLCCWFTLTAALFLVKKTKISLKKHQTAEEARCSLQGFLGPKAMQWSQKYNISL